MASDALTGRSLFPYLDSCLRLVTTQLFSLASPMGLNDFMAWVTRYRPRDLSSSLGPEYCIISALTVGMKASTRPAISSGLLDTTHLLYALV